MFDKRGGGHQLIILKIPYLLSKFFIHVSELKRNELKYITEINTNSVSCVCDFPVYGCDWLPLCIAGILEYSPMWEIPT